LASAVSSRIADPTAVSVTADTPVVALCSSSGVKNCSSDRPYSSPFMPDAKLLQQL
jgi:hypothetical protein